MRTVTSMSETGHPAGGPGEGGGTHSEQVRVQHKKRDALQEAMAALKEEDFGIPLQFQNFRD